MAAFLMDFVPKPADVVATPPDELYDKIEFAITCNETITDMEIDEYLTASRGQLFNLLVKGFNLFQKETSGSDE